MDTLLKSLDEIFKFYGSDKATSHPVVRDGKGHGYALVYDQLFTPWREAPIKFLEIGVGSGCSIRGWLDYFPNARVFGVDIVENTNPWNSPKEKPHERYTFCQGPQESETFWACFVVNYGTDWDIIVDDGGHCADQIITTRKCLWPHLNPGGLYCIEDLNTAYASISGFCPAGWQNHMDYIKDMLDTINRSSEIEWLHFSKELAVIKKA